jgi:hypothetical protein
MMSGGEDNGESISIIHRVSSDKEIVGFFVDSEGGYSRESFEAPHAG